MELLVIIIILALIFDYINGFHDAANSKDPCFRKCSEKQRTNAEEIYSL